MEFDRIKCDKESQETAIHFLRDSKVAHVTTSDNSTANKLFKLVEKDPNNWKLIDTGIFGNGDICSYTFECPKKCISFRASSTRIISDEQRKAMSERMKNMKRN